METNIRSCEGEALLKKRDLWRSIREFDLDGDAPFTFTCKLARDNSWSLDYASRVAEEYKKFVFLAMESGHSVSPSDAVDQAWHLHLCYTRSYWDDLCGQVLGRPLHHGPTRGGASESAKFADWYQRTLDSYREAFGSEPPADIWPAASERGARSPRFRRVDVASHWVLKKPSLGAARDLARSLAQRPREAIPFAPPVALASGLLALCVALLVAGDAPQVLARSAGGLNIFNWDGASFLALFWSLCAAGAVAVASVRGLFALPGDRNFPLAEPDAYSIARLSNAGDLPTDAALAAMAQARKVLIASNGRITRLDGAPPAHPWERAVWNASAGGSQTVAGVRSQARAGLKSLDAPLQKLGLLIEGSLAARVQRISLSIPLILILIGLVKIVVGASRGKPVGFLALTCFALGAAMIAVSCARPRLSKRGRNYLQHLRWEHTHFDLRHRASLQDEAAAGEAIALSLAIWGYSELDALGMAEARAAMRPVPSSSGGSDSSGCGGDGGGSGCGGGSSCGGGCGGCGG